MNFISILNVLYVKDVLIVQYQLKITGI